MDSYRYSAFIFIKKKDSDGGKLFLPVHPGILTWVLPMWTITSGVETSGWIFKVEPWDAMRMFWWKRLMQDPYYENLFYTRWHQLKQDELTNENIELAIDSIVELYWRGPTTKLLAMADFGSICMAQTLRSRKEIVMKMKWLF
ncbi:MAG: CotH kinase family protein [Bacteroidales bacterium]